MATTIDLLHRLIDIDFTREEDLVFNLRKNEEGATIANLCTKDLEACYSVPYIWEESSTMDTSTCTCEGAACMCGDNHFVYNCGC